MKRIMCAFVIFAALGLADEHADRDAIQNIVKALNENQASPGQKRIASLFSTDADSQLDRLSDLDRQMLRSQNKPWSEVSTPRIVVQSVRFITPDVALVDAANTQYGSTILVRRVPLLMVMRKETEGWRIVSFRVMVDLISMP